MNNLSLSRAQKVVTIIFLLCMVFMIVVANQYHKGKISDIIGILLSLYGTHFTIILTFYFTNKSQKEARISQFKFLLALFLIILWNVFIFLSVKGAKQDFQKFADDLMRFPEYAGFLIAAAIVWLYSIANETHE